MTPIEAAKKAAGLRAASFIQSGMTVGLGTGSTVFYFIERLGELCRGGLAIQAAASSEKSALLAREQKIPLLDMSKLSSLDIAVDGADEIDAKQQMIKGGGGALLREKIVASMSRSFIVIVDETKLVTKLGNHKLPVEIIPFGHKATIGHLSALGFTGEIRGGAKPFVTDNGNYIYDTVLGQEVDDAAKCHARIISVPGVVETGLFFDLPCRIIVGFLDGQTKTI